MRKRKRKWRHERIKEDTAEGEGMKREREERKEWRKREKER